MPATTGATRKPDASKNLSILEEATTATKSDNNSQINARRVVEEDRLITAAATRVTSTDDASRKIA